MTQYYRRSSANNSNFLYNMRISLGLRCVSDTVMSQVTLECQPYAYKKSAQVPLRSEVRLGGHR